MAAETTPSPGGSRIAIADVVNQLRTELAELEKASADQEMKFTLGEVEVELQVGLSWEAGGKIGFNCWIYQAEGGAKVNRETVQTVRLKLKPDDDIKLSRRG